MKIHFFCTFFDFTLICFEKSVFKQILEYKNLTKNTDNFVDKKNRRWV